MPTEIENGKVYMIKKDKYGNEKEIAIFDVKKVSSDTHELNCELTPPDRIFIGVNARGNLKVKNHSAVKKLKRINTKNRYIEKVKKNIIKKSVKYVMSLDLSFEERMEKIKQIVKEELKRQGIYKEQ